MTFYYKINDLTGGIKTMTYKISKELLQAMLNYLASQPYADVVQLINELQRLEKLPEKEEVEKPKSK